jgi:hypothetical protein
VKTGVVLCYGLYSSERKDYKQYLDFIAEEIDKQGLERVILCGGFTNPERSRDSEASTVQEYLLSVKPDFTNYTLEDKSINTNQNLEFAAQRLSKDDEIMVYGDLIRLAKIIWIAMHFLVGASQEDIYKAVFEFAYDARDLYKDFKYKNLKVVAFDFPGKTKEETIGQSFAVLLDVMALYDEKKNRMDVEQREKDLRLSS